MRKDISLKDFFVIFEHIRWSQDTSKDNLYNIFKLGVLVCPSGDDVR